MDMDMDMVKDMTLAERVRAVQVEGVLADADALLNALVERYCDDDFVADFSPCEVLMAAQTMQLKGMRDELGNEIAGVGVALRHGGS